MARSLYRLWDLVVYAGQFYRVCGWLDGRLYLRLAGWEHGQGWWGWDGYGRPITVATTVAPGAGLLYS